MDKVKASVEIVREDELQEQDKRVMSVSAIPNILELSNLVIEFLEFYDNNKTLRETNMGQYLNLMYEKFSNMPSSMIKLLSDEENRSTNLSKIIDMLETLSQVKKGNKNLEEARDEFVEKVNEEYFYPSFGGKEKLIQSIEDKGGKIN